ncbi:MAG: FGGY family carbohydrate kinase [Desulfurococcaceae archaeon]
MDILAVDLGTTNLKVSLINIDEKDNNISVIESITKKINPLVPVQRAHEHDPNEIRRELFKAIRHISRIHNIDAVVTSTCLFATIVINRKFEPLTNIITWIDERSNKYLGLLGDRALEIYYKTGCPPLHIYTLPKVLWLKHECPV